MDLTIIDETGMKSEQVRVPDTAASGRIAARLVQVMGLPRVGADGRPISYGFRHEGSGRHLGDEQTLEQAHVSQNDVLRLVPRAPIQGYTPAPEPAETQPLPAAPPLRQASAVSSPAATVLSPPPPPPSQQAASTTRFWPRSVVIALAVLAVALVGVGVAIVVSHGGRHQTRLVARDVVTETVGPSGNSTTPEGQSTEATGGETGEATTTSSTENDALPNISTQQMGLEIQQLLLDWHEDVVRGDYHAAWELLSRRKQAQAEGEGGYATWAKNQSTLRPYLNPSGLHVSVQDTGSESAVAQVDVTGMTWDKPGAHCSEWSGITWAKYENGEWRYDPGYSTTQQREHDWRSRYTELLGGSC